MCYLVILLSWALLKKNCCLTAKIVFFLNKNRSINRDTDHRTDIYGECNELQTGYPDGTYIQVMSSLLHT